MTSMPAAAGARPGGLLNPLEEPEEPEAAAVKALQSVAASGDDASRALKSGVLDAAEVVLSRLDMDRRARQALRFLEHE